jgi:hypothetical protein
MACEAFYFGGNNFLPKGTFGEFAPNGINGKYGYT